MDVSEIDAVRLQLQTAAGQAGRAAPAARRVRLRLAGGERRELKAVDLDRAPGEWSTLPGSDATRVLLFRRQAHIDGDLFGYAVGDRTRDLPVTNWLVLKRCACGSCPGSHPARCRSIPVTALHRRGCG